MSSKNTVSNHQTGNEDGKQDCGISRRKLFQYSCGCVGVAALVSVGGSLKAFAAHQTGLPQEGDVLVVADGADKGKPVALENLKVDGEPLLVLPMDPKGSIREAENSKILLYRTTPDKVSPSVKSSSAEGVVAFSALCTHLGCVLTNWVADKKIMVCPCHDAAFDVTSKGECVAGPGPRALPVLPLKLEANKFIVADDFSGWVGAKET